MFETGIFCTCFSHSQNGKLSHRQFKYPPPSPPTATQQQHHHQQQKYQYILSACSYPKRKITQEGVSDMFQLIIITTIAFKGAIRDCLQSPHNATNCLQHVRSSGPGATVCKSRATHRSLITCKCHVTLFSLNYNKGETVKYLSFFYSHAERRITP